MLYITAIKLRNLSKEQNTQPDPRGEWNNFPNPNKKSIDIEIKPQELLQLSNLIKNEYPFKYIIEKMEANIIALDCGEALGRTLADDFEKLYSEDNVVRYGGNLKVIVGFEKEIKNGREVLKRDKKGKLIPKEEFMSEWSVRRLKDLLYEQKIILPIDYKFDKQINAVVAIKSGTRIRYKCVSEENHLFDAWRVFAISEWLKKSFNETPKMKTEWGLGTFYKRR